MEIQIPPNFRLIERKGRHDSRGRIVNTDTGESYLLANRSWRTVNHRFSRMPQQVLRSMLRTASAQDPVIVLDIGAGEKFKAANELLNKNKRHRNILNVIGVDLVAATDVQSKVNRLRADALCLPLKTGSIDMAYSRQTIVHMAEGKPDVLRKSFEEVARVLNPGGIFFIDHEDYPLFEAGDSRLTDVVPEGTTAYSGKAGSFSSPLTKLGDVLTGRKYDSEFFALVKGIPSPPVAELVANEQLHLLVANITA